MSTYLIPACNMGDLGRRLERLNRRAEKLGLPLIQTRVLGVIPTQYGPSGAVVAHTRYEVAVEGLAPKLPGWEFVGTLEHTPAGNVMRILPGQNVPESFRTAPPACDHCKTRRQRKDTFLVRAEGGELKQVARRCIRDFLGHVSPDHIAWLASVLREFEELGSEEFSGRGKLTFAVEDIVEMSAGAIRQFGWVSRQASSNYAAKGGYLRATIDRVWFELDPTPLTKQERQKREEHEWIHVLPEDRALAAEALAWARELTPGGSDYLHNLKVISHKPYVEFKGRDGGLLASLVPAYQREVLKQVQERKKRETLADIAARSAYQGEVGKRQDWTLTLRKRIVIARNEFGTHADSNLFLYCFEDAAGNQFTWVTGKTGIDVVVPGKLADGTDWPRREHRPFVESQTYAIRGTVKEHRDYKGVKQTVLTRCQLEEVAA